MKLPFKASNVVRVAAVVVVCLLNAACGQSGHSDSKDKGQELFDSIAVPLGDTFIEKISGTNPEGAYVRFLQVKGVKLTTTPDAISEADKLNGLTWSGKFDWSAEVSRDIVVKQYSKDLPVPRIEPWVQGGKLALAYTATQINGKWQVRDDLETIDGIRSRPTEQEMQMLVKLLK